MTALRQALATGRPSLFHSDQGAQYTAQAHLALLREADVTISMSDRGKPTPNGIAERFMRTLKEEHVPFAEYTDFADACRQLQHWLEVV